MELDALLDAHPPGHLPPLLRAERALAKASAKANGGEADAEEAFNQAIDALRTAASPYHLAHGLLDQAAFLARRATRTAPSRRQTKQGRSARSCGAHRSSDGPRRWRASLRAASPNTPAAHRRSVV